MIINIDTINEESNKLWFRDDGNNTHALNYNIDENSMVIDLGGYLGKWVDIIINKYNPYITLVEPVPEFYNNLVNKFKDNPKVTILNYAISDINKKDYIYLNGDSTSQYTSNNTPIVVEFITIDILLDKIDKDRIDLMQINIEGEEYNLLNYMIDTGTISKFDNIQVQFHTFIKDAIVRREDIQRRLYESNFVKIYDYPFVFEGWSLKK